MSASWMVSVDGRAYGPYTDAQMAAFAAEGRLAPQSIVARAGEETFRPAGEEPALAACFDRPAPPAPKPSQPPSRSGAVFGRIKEEPKADSQLAHIVVIADVKARAMTGLQDEIFKLGSACLLLPQVWLLQTDKSVNEVRNVLVQQLSTVDVLFVVDATNNKAAWFNFSHEAEARIRRVWSGEPIRAAG
jgi:hypothetical protein